MQIQSLAVSQVVNWYIWYSVRVVRVAFKDFEIKI